MNNNNINNSSNGIHQSSSVTLNNHVDNTSQLNPNLNKPPVISKVNGHLNTTVVIDQSKSQGINGNHINNGSNNTKSQEMKMNSFKNNVSEQITNGMEALKNQELKSGDSTELKRKRAEIYEQVASLMIK